VGNGSFTSFRMTMATFMTSDPLGCQALGASKAGGEGIVPSPLSCEQMGRPERKPTSPLSLWERVRVRAELATRQFPRLG
jgi:hypothetical protein